MEKRKENWIGWAFVLPALIVFLAFVVFPFVASLLLSFTKWNFLSGFKGIKFVGLQNFRDMLKDEHFFAGLRNTLIYTVCTVPTSILFSLGLAYLLNGKAHCMKALRMAFFIPYISSSVALAAVFLFMFRSDGIVNSVIKSLFGLTEGPKWMADPTLCKVPIILLLFWTAIGYELVVYMAALQNVPRDLYEVSALDGASSWKQFIHITFPMISPTTFYLMVVRMIAAIKVFSAVNIMSLGTSNTGNTSIVMQIYKNAFQKYEFGYASAEAFVLFIILLAVTAFQFWGQKKWVHY